MENNTNNSAYRRFLTVLFAVIAILIPVTAMAQTDGGRRKRPKPKTELTTSPKKPDKKSSKKKRPDYNGHDYVDLGLPSGLKWATCNVGASSPEEYGGYYAWGETAVKDSYNLSSSLTANMSDQELRAAGIIDASNNLTMQHDAARVNWGGSWRMPTKAELEELVDKCTWTWSEQEGRKGYKVIGPNGNSIFLPAAGWQNLGFYCGGKGGIYNGSTVLGNSDKAFRILFSISNHYMQSHFRYFGASVRPVSE